jgi:Predicted membrane protein (DUF2306)
MIFMNRYKVIFFSFIASLWFIFSNVLVYVIHKLMKNDIFDKSLVFVHFVTGTWLIMIGTSQLSSAASNAKLHKSLGKYFLISIYASSLVSFITSFKFNTIANTIFYIPSSNYALTLLICGIVTYYFAINKNYESHQNWALRTYILTIFAWLYQLMSVLNFNKWIIHYSHGWLLTILPLLFSEFFVFLISQYPS